jgi:hypothetical protein
MKTQHRQLTQSLGFSTPNKPIRFFFRTCNVMSNRKRPKKTATTRKTSCHRLNPRANFDEWQ